MLLAPLAPATEAPTCYRMIDVAEPGWETTLRGEAAEMYARWRDELKPGGFHLSARVVSYLDGGVLGDVGLFLGWGK